MTTRDRSISCPIPRSQLCLGGAATCATRSLSDRPTGARAMPGTKRGLPRAGALLLWCVRFCLLALGRQAKKERGSESHERRAQAEKPTRVTRVRGRKVRNASDRGTGLRSRLRCGLNSRHRGVAPDAPVAADAVPTVFAPVVGA